MKWFVYIIECSDRTLYTGITIDVQTRIEQHNEGKGARYTKGRTPVKEYYIEGPLSKSDALKREYEIKKMSRKEKLGLKL